LGHLLAAVVTPSSAQERAEAVELANVDHGYTGTEPAEAAAAHGIQLEVV